MAITQFTDYDSIRAALGVNLEELEDGTLALDLYWLNLSMELDDISPQLQTDFTTIAALAEGDRTDLQRRFYEAAKLFATYSVANQLGTSLPLFGPKDVSDGKATVSRFSDSPYKVTIQKVTETYNRMRGRLMDAHAKLSSSSVAVVPRNFFAVSSPTTDPVVE